MKNPKTPQEKNSREELLRQLESSFNGSELNEICFILGVNYDDDLSGQIKSEKLVYLIRLLERESRLQELIDECRHLRPKANWDFTIEEIFDASADSVSSSYSGIKKQSPDNNKQITTSFPSISVPQKQTEQILEKPDNSAPSSVVDGSHSLGFLELLWRRIKKWLWVQLLLWSAFSVISFVSDLSGILDLTSCTRLSVTTILVFFGGVVILGISVLPFQRQSHQTWDRGLTAFLLIIFITALTWNATEKGCFSDWPGVNAQATSQINKFQGAVEDADKLEALSYLFSIKSPFGSTIQYDSKAFSLFFSLSMEDQTQLFTEMQVEDSTLILSISKIAPTLVEGYSNSTPILETMSERLSAIDGAEAGILKEELDLWLNGRALAASQDTELEVLQAYQQAAQINGENPSVLFELAKQFYFYGDNDLAFVYFDRTIQSAHNQLPLVEITEMVPNGAFTSVQAIENTILTTFANTPLLYSALGEMNSTSDYPNLQNLIASGDVEDAIVLGTAATGIASSVVSLVQITSILPQSSNETISEIIFSPDGETIYSAGNKPSIYLWRIDKYDISQNASTINSIQYLTMPKTDTSENRIPTAITLEMLVSDNGDGNLNVFNRLGEFIFALNTQINSVSEISSPIEGSYIALLGNEGSNIQIWDLSRRVQSRSLLSSGQQATSLTFKPYSDEMVIAGFSDGTLRTWFHLINDVGDPELIGKMSDSILDIVFTKDGSQFATLDASSNIIIWDTSSLKEVTHIENDFGLITTLDFSVDGKIALGTNDGTFHILNDFGEHLLTQQRHTVAISSMIFSPKESILAIAYIDGRIDVYQVIGNG